jgi:UDP-N-acetylglucosamine:LPS N-acetylglucosamine transferase
LIPYPYAQGHQLENALALEKEAAAVVIEEAQLTSDKLCENIVKLIHGDSERKCFEHNIQKFAAGDAAGSLAELALSLVR